jgi:hypothetical protein
MYRVQYLGYIVYENGVHVDPAKIQVIRDWTSLDHTNRASELLGTCQLLPMVHVGILPYFMGPQPSDQGWWKGNVCMGEGTTMII